MPDETLHRMAITTIGQLASIGASEVGQGGQCVLVGRSGILRFWQGIHELLQSSEVLRAPIFEVLNHTLAKEKGSSFEPSHWLNDTNKG